MSEELSRVKSRKKQYKVEEQPSVKAQKDEQIEKSTIETGTQDTGILSRRNRSKVQSKSDKAEQAVMQRKNNGADGEMPPSRSKTYTSERVRLSKMFVNSLIFLFVTLLILLLWWGIEGAPELRTLWR
ncbi:hypothetical protein [Paenibacillus sp. sgz500958]|uniref:hypothetical protein n=1 Tax=Paenibacillus sp. sgz500958 TaxID=3242475 RepID=UPI0036D2AE7D